MQGKFEYTFDTSLSILFKFYYGKITISDIESSWIYAFENNLIPKNNTGYILDYRNATFDFHIDEHLRIVEFYKKHIEYFKNFRIAIITENPKDVVVPILVEFEDDGYRSKPFSSLEEAIKWIKL